MTRLTLIYIVRQHSTSNHVAAPKVGQIWSNLTAFTISGSRIKIGTILRGIVIALDIHTHDAMTGCAARLSKGLGTLVLKATSSWRHSGLLLCTHPRLKGIRATDDGIKSHVCMLGATVLCATT